MPATRDVVRPKAPVRRAPARAKARDAVGEVVAKMRVVSRGLDDLRASNDRIRDGMARLAPLAEVRRAARAADAATEAREARSTPASVQAANATRWPRPGR